MLKPCLKHKQTNNTLTLSFSGVLLTGAMFNPSAQLCRSLLHTEAGEMAQCTHQACLLEFHSSNDHGEGGN